MLIIPMIEEVLVVEKRILLREEIRISKRRTTTSTPQKIELRREVVNIEREELKGSDLLLNGSDLLRDSQRFPVPIGGHRLYETKATSKTEERTNTIPRDQAVVGFASISPEGGSQSG